MKDQIEKDYITIELDKDERNCLENIIGSEDQKMNYKIKVYKTKNNEWNTKTYVSVTFNECFIVTGITVREGKNNSLFVAMPSYKSNKIDDNGQGDDWRIVVIGYNFAYKNIKIWFANQF